METNKPNTFKSNLKEVYSNRSTKTKKDKREDKRKFSKIRSMLKMKK